MNDKTFTVEDAIKIQKEQLLKWKSVLKPEKFDLLQQHADTKNVGVTNTASVFRGVNIDMYIQNTLMDK